MALQINYCSRLWDHKLIGGQGIIQAHYRLAAEKFCMVYADCSLTLISRAQTNNLCWLTSLCVPYVYEENHMKIFTKQLTVKPCHVTRV
jgi:hypothetical protein